MRHNIHRQSTRADKGGNPIIFAISNATGLYETRENAKSNSTNFVYLILILLNFAYSGCDMSPIIQRRNRHGVAPSVSTLLPFFLAASAVLFSPSLRVMAADDPAVDEAILNHYQISPKTPDLLSFLTRQSPVDLDATELARCVRDLGSADFGTRDAAEKKLLSVGPVVLPFVRTAIRDSNAEIAQRAGRVAQGVQNKWGPRWAIPVQAAIRVLRRRQEVDLATVLFRLLPVIEGDAFADEVWFTLDELTVKSGRVDRIIESGVKDLSPDRRAASGFFLGRRGTNEQQRLAKPLLRDASTLVRLRTAQGLLGSGDLDVVPTLIDLLTQKPVAIAWQAEELLCWLAGTGSPRAQVGAGGESSFGAQEAWSRWWMREKDRTSWKSVCKSPRRPLLLLIEGYLPHGGDRQLVSVYLCGVNGSKSWAPAKLPERMLIRGISNDDTAYGFTYDNTVDTIKINGGALVKFTAISLSGVPHTNIGIRDVATGDALVCRANAGGSLLIGGRDKFGLYTPGAKIINWHSPFDQDPPPRAAPPRSSTVILGDYGGLIWYADDIQAKLIDPTTYKTIVTDKLPPRKKRMLPNECIAPGGNKILWDNKHSRICEIDASGRVTWEIPGSTQDFSPYLIFPLVRLGLTDLPSEPAER